MKKLFALIVTAGLALGLFACAAPSFAILDDITITIGNISIQAHALRTDFEVTTLETTRADSLGRQVQTTARGVLLETILQQHGMSQHDFAAVNATGYDGYFVAIHAEILHNRDVLIAYQLDGRAIEPRIVIPEERAMFWVKYLRELELVTHAGSVEITREVQFDELLAELDDYIEEFKYYDADTLALPIAVLLEQLQTERVDFVTITAEDGLVKTERFSTFAGQVIVFDGTPDAPLFIGRDLPIGMRVRYIANIQIGEILVVM